MDNKALETLPVIVLKNIVLFPNSEIRLELDSNIDKEILSLASNYYDKHLIIVHQTDVLEKSIDIKDLSNVGILSFIEMKIDLPNNKTRVVIRGLERVDLACYRQEEDNFLLADIKYSKDDNFDLLEEMAYVRTLTKNFTYYLDNNPGVSNSILSKINGENNLSKLTDILSASLPIGYERKIEYINTFDARIRTTMILEDIEKELKVIEIEEEIDERVSKSLDKAQKDYLLQEKLKAIKEELGIDFSKDEEINSLKEKVAKLKCSSAIKKRLNREILRYEQTPVTSPEISIIKNYIDFMLSLPFGIKTTPNRDLKLAKEYLDESHYGLDDVKQRVLEEIVLKDYLKKQSSTIICLVGPPGVGKTTLTKEIAKCMNKKYVKISVGGVSDVAEIIGHRRTYIGASPGRILTGIKKSGSLNPVFVIDEIDKMCKDIKGDPASSLLEVLDKSVNNAFIDNYVEEEFDLSDVMFICTANNIYNIPLELLDRLEIINMEGYTEIEKVLIAKNYIIKKELDNLKIDKDSIVFKDKAIKKIIKNYTMEKGVRELERVIKSIIRKIIYDMAVNNNTQKKYIIDDTSLEKYLKTEKYITKTYEYKSQVGICNCLVVTDFGGDILPVEISIYKDNNEIRETGNLSDVFKESILTSTGFIKANCNLLNINVDVFNKRCIHLHMPSIAIKKDGPSGGVAITTAIISAIKKYEIPNDIAFTGEMTLKGNILPVGGIKDKIIGALNRNIKTIYIPYGNKKEVLALDKNITQGIKFVYVKCYEEIIKELGL